MCDDVKTWLSLSFVWKENIRCRKMKNGGKPNCIKIFFVEHLPSQSQQSSKFYK